MPDLAVKSNSGGERTIHRRSRVYLKQPLYAAGCSRTCRSSCAAALAGFQHVTLGAAVDFTLPYCMPGHAGV
ncbi:MAG: hypothetical protein J6A19_15690 [Oscillospiraceae bacterium]|nr:hypothetical protein [Oscillospiraceae bacterium]